jgi:rSAM/selenodomain-associated transferase 1
MTAPRVVLFARAPVPGQVKTRLARDLGDDRACDLYRRLGAAVVAGLTRDPARPFEVAVRFTPDDALEAVRAWIPGADRYEPQGPGDLGDRLTRAVRDAFDDRVAAVALAGTDCIAVTVGRVRAALDGLATHDAALGPARDGGYYLLALRRPLAVFHDVPWSTAAVAESTRALLRRAGATWVELPVESDVDTVDDLATLRVADPRFSDL